MAVDANLPAVHYFGGDIRLHQATRNSRTPTRLIDYSYRSAIRGSTRDALVAGIQVAKSVIIKGVQSPERLLDETALFLHRVIADLPAAKRQMLQTLHESDEARALRASRAADAVARARTQADGNVNPQLIAARLLRELSASLA